MGRIVPSFAADYIGPFNGMLDLTRISIDYILSSLIVLLTFTVISGGLMFAMFGATSNGAIIVFAILYGFFSGACKLPHPRFP